MDLDIRPDSLMCTKNIMKPGKFTKLEIFQMKLKYSSISIPKTDLLKDTRTSGTVVRVSDV